MTFAEDMHKVKSRFNDAITKGLSNPETFQEVLTQTLSEIEKYRTQVLNQVSIMEREMRKFSGQAEAFSSIGGIVYHILDSMVKLQDREDEQRAKLDLERQAALEEARLEELKTIEAPAMEKKTKKDKS